MPFAPDQFDAAMMVRVMHHVANVQAFLSEMARVLAGGSTFVVEHANKRHLKAILRYALRRQAWNPFTPEPYEFVEMNFDFHPDWIRARLAEAMFHVKRTLTVSHFRLPLLKRLLPARLLAAADAALQPSGAWWQLTPSIFLQTEAGGPASGPAKTLLFRCPTCAHSPLEAVDVGLACPACGQDWPVEDGIHDFKIT
jgi:SAM-dependent methyltransferase